MSSSYQQQLAALRFGLQQEEQALKTRLSEPEAPPSPKKTGKKMNDVADASLAVDKAPPRQPDMSLLLENSYPALLKLQKRLIKKGITVDEQTLLQAAVICLAAHKTREIKAYLKAL